MVAADQGGRDQGRVEAGAGDVGGDRSSGVKPAARKHVHVRNQMQSDDTPLFVDLLKPDRLLVPGGVGTQPPAPGSHFVDHYTCYKTKVSAGTTRFARTSVTMTDALGQGSQGLLAYKPSRLCVQADTGQGLLNPGVHLMCYAVKPTVTPVLPQGVAVADEFGATQLNAIKDEELCVPSLVGEDGGG